MTDDVSGNGKLLARIDERTKRMDGKMDDQYEAICKKADDHEDRLRALEKWRNVGAAAYGLGAAAIAWVTGQTQS